MVWWIIRLESLWWQVEAAVKEELFVLLRQCCLMAAREKGCFSFTIFFLQIFCFFLLYDCYFALLLGGEELRACRCRCRSTAALGWTRRWWWAGRWWYQEDAGDLGRWDDYILNHYDGDQGKMRWLCCPRWSVAMAGRTGSWSSGSRTKSRQ